MQYMSKDIMLDMLDYIRYQAEFIIDTTDGVKELNDFLCSQSGMVLYNSTCMCLQTIGETVRKIDELTDREIFGQMLSRNLLEKHCGHEKYHIP